MTTPSERADWKRAANLYKQFNAIVDDTEKINIPPDQLSGMLAESLARALAHYDGDEVQFVDDFLEICSQIHLKGSRVERFRRLYYDERLNRFPAYNPPGEERRRPKPFEAAVETCRRLRDLNAIRDCLAPLPSGAILGGSLSYGRFFNTVGPSKPSDTDVLLVIPTYDLLSHVVKALREVPGDRGNQSRRIECPRLVVPAVQKGSEISLHLEPQNQDVGSDIGSFSTRSSNSESLPSQRPYFFARRF